jgi:hypothetical protein
MMCQVLKINSKPERLCIIDTKKPPASSSDKAAFIPNSDEIVAAFSRRDFSLLN